MCLLVSLSLVLKTVEDDHLNDSLGNPGLISPDKEDLSRHLVGGMFEVMSLGWWLRAVRNKHNVLCIDGAIQRAHPGRYAAWEEDHSDGHCRPGARQVR